MTTKEKLKIIQDLSGLTQSQLAAKIGVSFVAFNNWWNEKSLPRHNHSVAINDLYTEYTGQTHIPETVVAAKKALIERESKKYANVLNRILGHADLYQQFLLSLTYNSNKIEGSTLSEDETADIMFDNRSVPHKSLIEHLEVKNHQAALQYLLQYLKNGTKLDETLILKLHSMLMNGIRDDAGLYRRHGVRIVGADVPTANYLKVPLLMKRIVADIRKKQTDSIAHVADIHGRFEQIHPFSDGNGRIGRLIMVAMLLREKMAPAVIRQEEKRPYYRALRRAQLTGDFTELENFVCDAILLGFTFLERKEQ